MVLSFSIRTSHPNDKRIAKWWNGLQKSERSREMRKILLSHIDSELHSMKPDVGNSLKEHQEVKLEMVDLSGGEKEIDLDDKLDMMGGMF